jgi:hypothetical protein
MLGWRRFPRSICCYGAGRHCAAGGETKGASEAARLLLPKKPCSRKSRRGKFPADECGFSVDPNLAMELRDAKLQLACLRLSSRKRTPYAVAQKAGKLHARIKEIQESLQCPCPSKYRMTYVVDGATAPGEIVWDSERLAGLWKRRMEKKTFTAEDRNPHGSRFHINPCQSRRPF